MRGKIIKSIAGFYEVHTGDTVYRCRAKGLFRALKQKPLVGDDVEIDITDTVSVPPEGNVIRLYPRTNALIRPNVANVDQALLVFSITKPYPSYNMLDRFLLVLARKDLHAVICFKVLDHKTTVITGPSGAGKSTLINLLCPHANMETGEISRKISRGKNTTRHVELLAAGEDTFLVDTPGFTSLYLQDLQAEDLKDYYPEFTKWADGCRFNGCVHIAEPDCAVKQALERGEISPIRYRNYCELFAELKNQRPVYKKKG